VRIMSQKKFNITLFDSPKAILKKASHITFQLIEEAIQKHQKGEIGIKQGGGRYFKKIRFRRLILHRIINCISRVLRCHYRWYTPYRRVKS
jgi:PHP family Zn ribbon phosphoesterase